MTDLIIVGGGLAGSEAAWQAASRGLSVIIYEMRPERETGAHVSSDLAELVCSNSLGSNFEDRAPGLLKSELRKIGSLLIQCADETAVPAGGALAVDRFAFSKLVTERIENHPRISVIRKEIVTIPDAPTIIASGPLTSDRLSESIQNLTGKDHLYFFDAISPIVTIESVNMEIAFRASRYDRGIVQEGDYINCPMTEDEYDAFVEALVNSKRIQLKSFEQTLEKGVKTGLHEYFEGCLPVEVMAQRGHHTLAFGPMRPVGLRDPRNDVRPFAVVQLRQDDLAGTLYNLVGFQTNLTFPEQQRVLRMIPGLERAEFVRYGQMHRNTFIFSPATLCSTLQFRGRDDLFFAGQITGVEGYAGNIGTGLVAGINAARKIQDQSQLIFPKTTMIGALCHYITHASSADFQPMKANFGLLPPLRKGKVKVGKKERARLYAQRSTKDLKEFIKTLV